MINMNIRMVHHYVGNHRYIHNFIVDDVASLTFRSLVSS
jgi:hypothetical protein